MNRHAPGASANSSVWISEGGEGTSAVRIVTVNGQIPKTDFRKSVISLVKQPRHAAVGIQVRCLSRMRYYYASTIT